MQTSPPAGTFLEHKAAAPRFLVSRAAPCLLSGVMVRVLPRLLVILGLLWAPPASALCELHCLAGSPDAPGTAEASNSSSGHEHHGDAPTQPPPPRDSVHTIHHEDSPDPDPHPNGTIHPAHHETGHHEGSTDRNPPPLDATRSSHHEAAPADPDSKGRDLHKRANALTDNHPGTTHCSKSASEDLDPTQAHERDCSCLVELTSGAPGAHRSDALAPMAMAPPAPLVATTNHVVHLEAEPPQSPPARSIFAERSRPLLV